MSRYGGGSIVPRGDGVWQLFVPVGSDPYTGKRRRLVETFRGTERQATKRLAAMVAGAGESRSKATVAALAARWLPTRQLSPTTRAEYQRVLDRWILPGLGAMPLDKLRADTLDGFYGHLQGEGVSDFRVRRCHEVLSSMLTQAVKWDWIERNPAERATPPVPLRSRPEHLPAGSVIAVLAGNDDFSVFVRLAAVTGARRGELVGLQWHDLRSDAALIIRRSVVYTPASGVVVKGTKTNRWRVVSLDPQTVDALEWLRLSRSAAGSDPAQDSFVFTHDPDGLVPWRPDYATARMRRLARSAGLDISLHDLRHFVATTTLAGGIDAKTGAHRLGHTQLSTFTDLYAAAVPARDRAVADLLARSLNGLGHTAQSRDEPG